MINKTGLLGEQQLKRAVTRTYRTVQGDMWDIISLRVYGTEMLMHLLVEANHQYRDIAILPANYDLVVPPAPTGDSVAFPPWRADQSNKT